jgi:hypothetical protein
MNTRQGTAIGIAAGIGTTILSLALPHFFPALSSTALNLMGVTGVALLVGSIVSLLLPNILSRSSKGSPLEIIFDRNNPDGKFWSIEIAVDESNNGPQVRYWEYRAGIKNTSQRTVRNVSVTTEWIRKAKGLPHQEAVNQEFKRFRTTTCDLKPGCQEMVTIHRWWYPARQPGNFAGESVLAYGTLAVTGSADDVLPTVRHFKFNPELEPMIFDWVGSS